MVKIDNYYKVVASTFGIAYFIGIVVALIYSTYKGDLVTQVGTDFIKNLSLTSSIYFKQTIFEVFNNSVNLFLIPFSYLIAAVQYSYIHVNLLTSSFLGQVKLLVQLIPQFLFFISYIIFSTIGIKTILLIVKLFLNNFIIKENKYKIREKFFNKDDINLLYIALISIVLGAIIQTHLIKVLFIFFINLKSIAYILIIIIYLFLFMLSAYVTYKTINEYFKKNKKENL
jgi:hypothetical protein